MKYESGRNNSAAMKQLKLLNKEVSMPKYILKKDLPFAKAGEEVKIINEGKAIEAKGCQCDIPDLFLNDWIEETKPREFRIAVYEDGREELIPSNRYFPENMGMKKIIRTLEIID